MIHQPDPPSFEDRLAEGWPSLSKSHRAVARYIEAHLNELVFMSVRELAERTGTSTATIIRFAQAIGFEGYPDLLSAIQTRILHSLERDTRLGATLTAINADHEDSAGILSHTLQRDIVNLEETLRLVDADEFAAALDLLRSSRIIYLAGTGISAGVVELLAFRMRRLARPVVTLTATGSDFYNVLLPITKEDLLVSVGFQPIPVELKRATELARRRGVPILALTDTYASPLSEVSASLHISRGPITHLKSITAATAVAAALGMALTLESKDQAKEVYEEFVALSRGSRESFELDIQ